MVFLFSAIHNGFENLNISLIALNQNSQEEEQIGQLTIPLNRLNDQIKREEWYEFYDSNGTLAPLKIFLSLQWIYSKVNF